MNVQRACVTAVAGVALAGLLAACGQPGGDPEPGTASASASTSKQIKVTAAPPTSQINEGGRSDIKFDPCTEFDDLTITRAGFNPDSRKRSDQIHNQYAFVGCSFNLKEPRGSLGEMTTVRYSTVWTSNISLAEFRKRWEGSATDTQVAGRPAIQYTPERKSCSMAIEFPGFVLDVTSSSGLYTQEAPCDNLQNAATVLEAAATETVGR
ncbi:DUF3558 domain-containing protein [Nocardia camponoti]|uniref:DUF3558 domain-containing protein n=1 Tax=Nocardia camponoti TaxID=1616106 RepID=A0A917V5S0_9NOCA|nr:DUF3558 domain-containing protein [Nocardia camponoti]GGK40648.1 hypothetical protein GCM10011591_10300 [Nocardia camponoti]